MSRMRHVSAVIVFCVVGVAVWLIPSLALACGAFVPTDLSFSEVGDLSSLTDLVGHDQEQMVYVVDDGRLTVYQGRSFAGNRHQRNPMAIDAFSLDDQEDESSTEFAWLLPVPGTPEIEMAPSEIFDRLDDKTAPSFVLEDTSDGDCPAEVRTLVETKGAEDGSDIARGTIMGTVSPHDTLGDDSVDLSAVDVVASGEVGPFEHTTITTREGLDRPGKRALEWLEEHGYSLEAVDDELLDIYLGQGSNLLAFRLRAEADTGEVRPVAITVDADQALSPIRLGAMGAAEQTRIQVWVAAPHLVVPETYARVQPNQALIDWSDGGRNYDAVVASAVREAGGQAFAIDATMDTSELGEFLLSSERLQRWEEIRDSSADSAEDRRTQFMELARFLDELNDDDSIDISGESEALQQDYLPIPDSGPFTREVQRQGVEFLEPAPDSPEIRTRIMRPILRTSNEVRFDHLLNCYVDNEEGVHQQREVGRLGDLSLTISVDTTRYEYVKVELESSSMGEDTTACMMEHIGSTFETGLDRLERFVRDQVRRGEEMEKTAVSLQIAVVNSSASDSEFSTEKWMEMFSEDELAEVDWEAMVEAIDDELLAPRRCAQKRLASVDKLTRLSTTMSPQDMTRDAYFVEDPAAEPRPRRRRATRTVLCGEESEQRKEVTRRGEKRIYTTRDWRFDPPYGTAVEGHDEGWPDDPDDEDAAYDVVEPRSDRGGSDPEEARRDGESESAWGWIVGLVVAVMLPTAGVAVVTRRR